jgi:hypothetical protein
MTRQAKLRKVLKNWRLVEWTLTNDPYDTDEQIKRRLENIIANIEQIYEGGEK